MAEPITYVDTSTIRPGRLEELQAAAQELASFVEANESAPLAYNIYIDTENHRMTVVQIHPSPESLEFHMDVAGAKFREFKDLLDYL